MNRVRKSIFKTLGAAALAYAGLSFAPSAAHATAFNCDAYEVVELPNRIQVVCNNTINLNGNSVFLVTIANTNDMRVQRFIATALAAILSGKRFKVDLPPASATNVVGCAAGNCRTATRFGLLN